VNISWLYFIYIYLHIYLFVRFALIFISCIFGEEFKYVHPSPNNKNSYFFTNNRELKYEIINKGWNYIYINMVLSEDSIISSLQSKYIKFLNFLDDFPQFQNAKIIVYFDEWLGLLQRI
jgi:hypothetical protein